MADFATVHESFVQ